MMPKALETIAIAGQLFEQGDEVPSEMVTDAMIQKKLVENDGREPSSAEEPNPANLPENKEEGLLTDDSALVETEISEEHAVESEEKPKRKRKS